ncbi:17098_t:CDS:2 [Funneliformis geosporum]|uniref:856_t:CDS:1 n=1 Tax=Funneliformis geosporum TaxID=1117311 RepID=A0A9W4WWF3_9GLOM|nr:856_t:CDS:2 [Funneliformis geosporum]CAI2184118.1 17098_t:CDS:2 [Funneliformis geosporum]
MSKPEKYRLKHTLTEPTKTSFYGVSFNHNDSHGNAIFAVVGGRNVIVARFDSDKSVALSVVQTYVDDDEEENFYCCAWSVDPNVGAPLLAVAGATGILKILNTSVGIAVKDTVMQEINEIKFHPKDRSLLFSASKDFSIRLWNLKTMRPVVIFGGECGHREPVLSIDVHLSGDFLVSSGMDHAVKIWTLCTPVIKHTIESSFITRPSSSRSPQSPPPLQKCCSSHGTASMPVFVHFPIFSTTQLHNNYVDCVRWYGDLLMSRCAADTTIMLWKPDVELVAFDKSNVATVVVGGPAAPSKQPTSFDIICEFEFNHCDIWFLRFGISPDYRMLASGNQVGQIYLWDLQDISYYIDDYIAKKKSKSSGAKKEKVVVRKKGGTTKVNKKSSDLNETLAAGSSSRVGEYAVIKKPTILDSDPCESTIRQLDFSKDRQWIVAVCDDGSIWCWRLNIDVKSQEIINKDKVINNEDKVITKEDKVTKGSGNNEDDPMIIDD